MLHQSRSTAALAASGGGTTMAQQYIDICGVQKVVVVGLLQVGLANVIIDGKVTDQNGHLHHHQVPRRGSSFASHGKL